MFEKLKNIIKKNRGLALSIRENNSIGFYKIWLGFNDEFIGNVTEFHKESSIKVEGDYDKTYDNVMEVLVESFTMMFYSELEDKSVIALLKDKDLSNIKTNRLYDGYTEFVLSNEDYRLFVY